MPPQRAARRSVLPATPIDATLTGAPCALHQARRSAEAARLGFRVAVVPAEPGQRSSAAKPARTVDGMRVLEVPGVLTALDVLRLTARSGRVPPAPEF